MIYKLLNKLFGWDYIQWENSASRGVARVHVDGMRRVWYWRYKGIKAADIIEDPAKVIWLTCSPNKYFPPSLPKQANIDTMGAMKRAHNELYVKPKRYEVRWEHYGNGKGCWVLCNTGEYGGREVLTLKRLTQNNDEHREAAEEIASIYERVMS